MQPVPAADPRARERALRTALAEAEDPTEPALRLSRFLVAGERHPEALQVVDHALTASRAPELRRVRAGLLRDLARPDLAVAELRALVRERGDRAAPDTLFELAQVEWVVGQRQDALRTLRTLGERHADGAWMAGHAAEFDAWQARITAEPAQDPLANGSMRDLFALLRAAPAVTARIRVLESLAQPPEREEDRQRRPMRLRAIAVACADESAAVRARAVQLAIANRLANEAFWTAALADRSALVRRFAAVGVATCHADTAPPALLRALAAEQDPRAFEALHAALAHVHGIEPPACDATTSAGRKATLLRWQQRGGR
ncbi:MAG TPA: hypothetical protein ENI87_11110 [bacterium]|nr:hypothetical protein [bacterium]